MRVPVSELDDARSSSKRHSAAHVSEKIIYTS